jgi:hypothetical protein
MPLWKKYFISNTPCGRVHVLVVHHAADRRFVHADVVGDVAQHQRAQVLDSLIEELALEIDDARSRPCDGLLR